MPDPEIFSLRERGPLAGRGSLFREQVEEKMVEYLAILEVFGRLFSREKPDLVLTNSQYDSFSRLVLLLSRRLRILPFSFNPS
jgi:hypothetical protein